MPENFKCKDGFETTISKGSKNKRGIWANDVMYCKKPKQASKPRQINKPKYPTAMPMD